MIMIRKLILALLVISAAFFSVSLVQAQDDFPTDNEVNAIAKKLYCPVCPNTPLDVCETKACQDWRAEIRMQLADGWSEEKILDYFVEQYGERVLAEPERRGFTSLVWILPVVAVLLGLAIVAQVLRNWKSGQQVLSDTAVSDPPLDPDTLAQIEEELRQIE
jgi:cytochrome c-type biogenesis protein CcmH